MADLAIGTNLLLLVVLRRITRLKFEIQPPMTTCFGEFWWVLSLQYSSSTSRSTLRNTVRGALLQTKKKYYRSTPNSTSIKNNNVSSTVSIVKYIWNGPGIMTPGQDWDWNRYSKNINGNRVKYGYSTVKYSSSVKNKTSPSRLFQGSLCLSSTPIVHL